MAPAFPVVVATVTTFSPREFWEAICAHSGDKEDCNCVFVITDLHITCKLSHPDLLNKNMNIDLVVNCSFHNQIIQREKGTQRPHER